nr:unnamed protein product [Callosobruchus analis]
MNVHVDCQEKASKCQTKARLLRRQKSTSEIETRVPEPNVDDESKFGMLTMHLVSYIFSFFIYIILVTYMNMAQIA